MPKPISTEFRKHGFWFTQTKRVGQIALYRQHVNGGGTDRFEVVKIRVRPESVFRGKPIPGHESYPSDEQWGTYGWTFWDLRSAEEKFNALLELEENRG